MAHQSPTRPSYPAVGEVFELTMGSEVTGLGLIQAFGYDPAGWTSTAKTIPAGTTQKFKFVQVGYQEDLAAVASACRQHGEVPEGVWMQVLDETFVQDGQGPVGIADPSWERPGGDAGFPMVVSHGVRHFDWADDDRSERWRWLVAV